MRIVGSRLEHVGGAVGRLVGAAGRGVSAREGVLLTLTGDNGETGLGEASPLPGYSPDSLVDARVALDGVEQDLGPLALDLPAAEALERVVAPASHRLSRSPAARFALETAVLDLLGRTLGVAAHRLLGAASGPCHRAGLLGAPLDPSAVDLARALARRGLQTLKAKVGGPAGLEAELAILLEVRRAVPAVTLRLDANGAWDPPRARDALRRLGVLDPELVEEPCHGEALLSLGPCAVPWAADESLLDEGLAERLLAAPGLGAVVLKPALLGGFLRARRLALAAHARGRRAIVTHLFDGPVALAAACELALSLPAEVHGLDPHAALAAYPRWPVAQLASTSAEIRPVGAGGIGLEPAPPARREP